MAKNRDRRNRPSPDVPRPVSPVQDPRELSTRSRLDLQQIRAAESRLMALLGRLGEVEGRLDEKIRDANSLIKSLNDINRNAGETVKAVERAIEFIAQQDVAEILQTEVAAGIAQLNIAIKTATEEKVEKIIAEFDLLRDVLHGVKGKKTTGAPDLGEIVAGIVLDESLRRKQQ